MSTTAVCYPIVRFRMTESIPQLSIEAGQIIEIDPNKDGQLTDELVMAACKAAVAGELEEVTPRPDLALFLAWFHQIGVRSDLDIPEWLSAAVEAGTTALGPAGVEAWRARQSEARTIMEVR